MNIQLNFKRIQNANSVTYVARVNGYSLKAELPRDQDERPGPLGPPYNDHL